MKPRRSKPPTPTSNAILVAGLGFIPPVALGLLRGTLDRGELALITVVVVAAAVATYGISRAAYRRR